jgi:hypothetical protein
MFEGEENNGVHENDGMNGNGAEAPVAAAKPRKRVLTRDLSARIAELERKLEAMGEAKPEPSSDLEQRIADLADSISKLDERMSKIAHAVAQSNLMRGSLA